jgi:hypothetical protein
MSSKLHLMESDHEHRVREILASAKRLAVEYYNLTGKPLGITGEVAEYIAAETLGLKLAPERTQGFDARPQYDLERAVAILRRIRR